MQQFKISTEGLTALRKKTLIRSVPLMVIAVGAGIFISTLNSKVANDNIMLTLTPFCIIALILSFSLYAGIRKQRKLFESYVLTFENNTITRQQLNTPTIAIDYSDITEISKHKNGIFTIKSKKPGDVIGVPVQIENYNELEQLLNDIILITEKRETLTEKFGIIMTILFLGAFVTVNAVDNKIIVAVAGAVTAGGLSWSLVELQRSKNVDSKTKRNSWIVLLIAASVFGTVIIKLTK